MSLTETEKDQLAGPRRLEELPPPPFDFVEAQDDKDRSSAELPVVDIVPDSLEVEPSFLVNARNLATAASDSAMARSRLAQAEMAAGNKSNASRHALEALELPTADTDDSAVYAAIRTLLATGHDERAEEMLAKLAKPGPLSLAYATIAARRGDLDEAFVRLDEEDSLDAWELRGWIALQQSHFDQAIRFYRKAMALADPSPALLANLGFAHAALGAPDKAIAETKRALALGPLQRQRVGLNLVAFLFSVGASDEGFRELRRLQEAYPTDIELVFAEAHWALAVGDVDRADQRLRYGRSSLWSFASELQQAELLANRIYLRHYRNELSPHDAAEQIIHEMQRTEWRSTRLVSMVPILLYRYSDAPRLAQVRDELVHAHPDETFRVLEMHLAILHDDSEEATRHALKWAKEALFAPEASSWAVFLLNQVENHLDDAIKLGTKALRRMPAAVVVANNTAYSLALAGHANQAKEFLRRGRNGKMFDLATQGLICAVKGDIREANNFYDRAENVAEEDGGVSGSVLVNLHRRLIGVVSPEVNPAEITKPVVLPKDWDDFPSIVMCLRMLKRRQAPLDQITIDGTSAPLPERIEPGIS